MSWKSIASAKKASLTDLIPSEWRLSLSDVPPPTRLRDFGHYICRFLSPQELEITNAPSNTILTHIRSGEWSAVDVTSVTVLERLHCHAHRTAR